MICFITGGQRSGKSRYAQNRALELSSSPLYIATARIWDKEFEGRVDRHVQDRDERWTTLEEEKHISRLPLENATAVIDCVTLWLTNFFVDTGYDVEKSLFEVKKEFDNLCRVNASLFIISNEIGMGIHAESETGRKFTDLQGWANQYMASRSDKVVLMVSGIPVPIK